MPLLPPPQPTGAPRARSWVAPRGWARQLRWIPGMAAPPSRLTRQWLQRREQHAGAGGQARGASGGETLWEGAPRALMSPARSLMRTRRGRWRAMRLRPLEAMGRAPGRHSLGQGRAGSSTVLRLLQVRAALRLGLQGRGQGPLPRSTWGPGPAARALGQAPQRPQRLRWAASPAASCARASRCSCWAGTAAQEGRAPPLLPQSPAAAMQSTCRGGRRRAGPAGMLAPQGPAPAVAAVWQVWMQPL